MKTSVLLICACQRARVYPEASLDALTQRLNQAGVDFQVVPDLCKLVGRRDSRLADWSQNDLAVVACHPRAVKWLFDAAGAPLPPDSDLYNLRGQPAESISEAIVSAQKKGAVISEKPLHETSSPAAANVASPSAEWPGWFPVIDYDRCTQCMQCLSFCLFGVYGVDDQQRIQVSNPDQCKPNCPACARVCPQAAIVFPKHPSASISGGAVPAGAAGMPKVDISALLGGDAHSLLRERSAQARTRFSKDRSTEQALSERRQYLARHGLLADDIPAEVLMNLPSPELIAVKVKEAAARAQAVLEARKKP